MVLLLAGCAGTQLKTDFVDDSVLEYERARYPNDAAVVLYRADRTLLSMGGARNGTETLRHEVFAVQSEGGLEHAALKIALWSKQKLAGFRARVISTGGVSREVDSSFLLADAMGTGDRDLNSVSFQFPGVSVGDIVEYIWVIQSPWVAQQDDQDTLGPYPVRRYEFELTASKPLVLETISHNATSCVFRAIRSPVPREADHLLRCDEAGSGYFAAFGLVVKPSLFRIDSEGASLMR